MMDDFNSETDSDYTSYWRDWVSLFFLLQEIEWDFFFFFFFFFFLKFVSWLELVLEK